MRLGIRKKAPILKLAVILVIMFLLTVGFIFFLVRAEPIFRYRAADAATQVVRDVIDGVAADVFTDSNIFSYNDISDGDIAVVDMNTAKINSLRTEFSKRLSQELANTHSAKIQITLGSLTDYAALQGIGVKIPVKIYFGSISRVEIKDEFISAGINQTKYRASLDVTVSASVVSSFMTDSRDININLPICERIFIGNVPNYYIPGKG